MRRGSRRSPTSRRSLRTKSSCCRRYIQLFLNLFFVVCFFTITSIFKTFKVCLFYILYLQLLVTCCPNWSLIGIIFLEILKHLSLSSPSIKCITFTEGLTDCFYDLAIRMLSLLEVKLKKWLRWLPRSPSAVWIWRTAWRWWRIKTHGRKFWLKKRGKQTQVRVMWKGRSSVGIPYAHVNLCICTRRRIQTLTEAVVSKEEEVTSLHEEKDMLTHRVTQLEEELQVVNKSLQEKDKDAKVCWQLT